MCKCQVRDRWKISPRCLWEVVTFSAWLQNRSGGWRDGLFVMVRTPVFAALKVTLHKSGQVWDQLDTVIEDVVGSLCGDTQTANHIVNHCIKLAPPCSITNIYKVPVQISIVDLTENAYYHERERSITLLSRVHSSSSYQYRLLNHKKCVFSSSFEQIVTVHC